mmetsp:Transcript_11313/g.29654  ORF Transcript_11313/g.29654 Transcript_11313/m.29654 type:complete len:309 (-) Transcript_11313:7-933(-)
MPVQPLLLDGVAGQVATHCRSSWGRLLVVLLVSCHDFVEDSRSSDTATTDSQTDGLQQSRIEDPEFLPSVQHPRDLPLLPVGRHLFEGIDRNTMHAVGELRLVSACVVHEQEVIYEMHRMNELPRKALPCPIKQHLRQLPGMPRIVAKHLRQGLDVLLAVFHRPELLSDACKEGSIKWFNLLRRHRGAAAAERQAAADGADAELRVLVVRKSLGLASSQCSQLVWAGPTAWELARPERDALHPTKRPGCTLQACCCFCLCGHADRSQASRWCLRSAHPPYCSGDCLKGKIGKIGRRGWGRWDKTTADA